MEKKRQYEEGEYGINQEYAHPNAIALIPEEFFWDCTDELAPFGSDEGDTALAEYRNWKVNYPDSPVYECIKWTIEDVGEMLIDDYNGELLDKDLIKSQVADEAFDDRQYIFTMDVSVIATGFGQLVDEGKMDAVIKPFMLVAVERQALWAEVNQELAYWEKEDAQEYIERMHVLKRALQEA